MNTFGQNFDLGILNKKVPNSDKIRTEFKMTMVSLTLQFGRKHVNDMLRFML